MGTTFDRYHPGSSILPNGPPLPATPLNARGAHRLLLRLDRHLLVIRGSAPSEPLGRTSKVVGESLEGGGQRASNLGRTYERNDRNQARRMTLDALLLTLSYYGPGRRKRNDAESDVRL